MGNHIAVKPVTTEEFHKLGSSVDQKLNIVLTALYRSGPGPLPPLTSLGPANPSSNSTRFDATDVSMSVTDYSPMMITDSEVYPPGPSYPPFQAGFVPPSTTNPPPNHRQSEAGEHISVVKFLITTH